MTIKEVADSAERYHRTLRLLALIRSITVQMQIQERDAEESALHLASRVGAIGRAALTPITAGTDLESLVLDELLVHSVHRSGIFVDGPAVRLTPSRQSFWVCWSTNSSPIPSSSAHCLNRIPSCA